MTQRNLPSRRTNALTARRPHFWKCKMTFSVKWIIRNALPFCCWTCLRRLTLSIMSCYRRDSQDAAVWKEMCWNGSDPTSSSRIRECLSLADTEKLVHALDNANSLMYGIPKFLIDRLQNVKNTAARVVTLTKKHDHIETVLKQPHWHPVNQRINYKILLQT